MSTLYVIRHGQASFGAENYDKLSPKGQRQADLMGEYFANANIKFDAAYSGDLSRQRETASRAIASQDITANAPLTHHIDPRFNEVRNGEHFEYLLEPSTENNPELKAIVEANDFSSKHYQKLIEATFTHWVSPSCTETNIQSWANYSTNVANGLKQIMKQNGSGKTVALFTSGGTIATIAALILDLKGRQIYRFYEPVVNCSITQLFYNASGKISLSNFNDYSYLKTLEYLHQEKLVTYR